MKKILLILAIIAVFNSTCFGASDFVANDLQIKKSIDPDFSTIINTSPTGTDFILSFNIIPKATAPSREYKLNLNLPAWLTYVSNTIESDTCSPVSWATTNNLKIDSASNWDFVFRFKPTWASICESIIQVTYRTNWLAVGSNIINYTLIDSFDNTFWNWNDILSASNNVQAEVSAKISLMKAYSLDSNNNWFIDWYNLVFDRNIVWTPTMEISQNSITSPIWTFTPSWSTAVLTFGDNIFTTAQTPQVKITWDVNYENWAYFAWVVEDTAKPFVIINPTWWTYNSSQNVTITSNETWNIYYDFTNPASNTSTLYAWAISINSNKNLYYYTSDFVWNISTWTLNYIFQCSIIAPLNWTITVYPGCVVSCNAWYTLNAWNCISTSWGGNSWWGWGGGWGWGWTLLTPDICPNWDKSGNIYDKKCESSTSSTWTTWTSSWITSWWTSNNPNLLSSSTLSVVYFASFLNAKNYLYQKITNKTILASIDSYYSKLLINDFEYYMSVDPEFRKTQNWIMNTFVLYFIKLDEYLRTKNSAILNETKILKISLDNFITNKINPTDKYITVYLKDWKIEIYRTKFEKLKKALSILETKVIWKFDKLKNAKVITEEEYIKWIKAYNNFILDLTIYRNYPNKFSKTRALENIKIFIWIYSKKIPTIQIPQKILIKDKFTFTRDLKFWDYWDDVKNLQIILKSYWYFDNLDTTWYFWNITKTKLIEFSKNVLKINSTDWIFNSQIRQAIGELEYK